MDRKQYIASILEGLHAVFQAVVRTAPAILDEFGITHTQMFILSYIKENEDVSVKQLARMMGITSSAATQQVNGLVKRGFLVREESNIDRRLVKIRLAEKIVKRTEQLQEQLLDRICDFFSVVNDEELEQYYRIQSKIVERIMQ